MTAGRAGLRDHVAREVGDLVQQLLACEDVVVPGSRDAHEAFRLDVPLHLTWSCYKGSLQHCGRCGTCVERLEAIADVNEAPDDWDRTLYLDSEFWKTAVAEYQENH